MYTIYFCFDVAHKPIIPTNTMTPAKNNQYCIIYSLVLLIMTRAIKRANNPINKPSQFCLKIPRPRNITDKRSIKSIAFIVNSLVFIVFPFLKIRQI